MKKDNPTKKEHYIPQVYLKGFASSEKRLYFYDLNTHSYSNQMVPIKTICYQNNLYEYRNDNNDIIHTNNIEQSLGNLEAMFPEKIASIRSRINVVNPKTTSFFPDKEAVYWITYLIIQAFRLPKVIDGVATAISDMIPTTGNAHLCRNTTLYVLLPFLNNLAPNSPELNLYYELFNIFSSLRCTIAYDEKHRLFTSDCPLFVYSPSHKILDCQRILFPIDPSLCLMFNQNDIYPDNGIIPINDYEYENIFKSIVCAADNRLFLSRKFTKHELQWIQSTHNDITPDLVHLNLKHCPTKSKMV